MCIGHNTGPDKKSIAKYPYLCMSGQSWVSHPLWSHFLSFWWGYYSTTPFSLRSVIS